MPPFFWWEETHLSILQWWKERFPLLWFFHWSQKNRSCSKIGAKEDLLIYSFLIGPGPRVSAFCSHMSENCITLSSCLYLAPSTVRAMDWTGQTLWTPEQKMSENSGPPPQRKRNYVAKLMVDHECNFLQEFPHFLRFFMVEVLQKNSRKRKITTTRYYQLSWPGWWLGFVNPRKSL